MTWDINHSFAIMLSVKKIKIPVTKAAQVLPVLFVVKKCTTTNACQTLPCNTKNRKTQYFPYDYTKIEDLHLNNFYIDIEKQTSTYI